MKSRPFRSDEGRLRAGWRILLFFVLLIGLSAVLQLGVRALRGGLPKGSTLGLSLVALAATLAVLVARRHVDKKSLMSLGLAFDATALRDLLFGFGLSGLMAGAIFGTMVAAGLVEDVGIQWGEIARAAADGSPEIVAMTTGTLLLLLVPTILTGWWEEIVFRGYLFQNMVEGMGLKISVLVSCLIYGLVHAANPNAGLLSSLIIVGFGFLRLYGYLATTLLWLSIGMHIGWNFFQGPVFGYAASGQAQSATLFTHTASGPDWLTGGDFGPEASVITIPVVLATLLAMRAWSRSSLRSRVME